MTLVEACQKGNLPLLERLLQDPTVDPSAHDNCAIKLASRKGHLNVVERLLLDKRVDPSARNNQAITFASYKGHLKVVERLLQDKRVDPSAEDNYSIRLASEFGHLNVVERLLLDKRVLPSTKIDFIQHFGQGQGNKIHKCYKNIYTELRKHVCTIMFGLQSLELPALQILAILDEVYDLAYLLPYHTKWEMIVLIKHFKH